MYKKYLVIILMMLAILLSCNQIAENVKNNNSKNNTNQENNGNFDNDKVIAELQSKIDSTVSGGIVTFEGRTYKASQYITITKAITIDGKEIQGLAVKVSSNVIGNVTLKNFKDATIQVIDIPATNRSDISTNTNSTGNDSNNTTFKKYTDDSVPIKLEGCSIEKIESEAPIALYLENEDKKSKIEEINLKEGTKDFTFVEFDKQETTLEEKSKVEKLFIKGGDVDKINLIGRTFSDIALVDDFSREIDFNYDKEFIDDQLKFSDKESFLDEAKIKDIFQIAYLIQSQFILQFQVETLL